MGTWVSLGRGNKTDFTGGLEAGGGGSWRGHVLGRNGMGETAGGHLRGVVET